MRNEPQYSDIKSQLTGLECSNNCQAIKTLVLEWMEANPPENSFRKIKTSVNLVAKRSQ